MVLSTDTEGLKTNLWMLLTSKNGEKTSLHTVWVAVIKPLYGHKTQSVMTYTHLLLYTFFLIVNRIKRVELLLALSPLAPPNSIRLSLLHQ